MQIVVKLVVERIAQPRISPECPLAVEIFFAGLCSGFYIVLPVCIKGAFYFERYIVMQRF
jgi:hypothetical protein